MAVTIVAAATLPTSDAVADFDLAAHRAELDAPRASKTAVEAPHPGYIEARERLRLGTPWDAGVEECVSSH